MPSDSRNAPALQIRPERRVFEIVASIVTGLGKILFVDVLDLKLIFIITAILFWIGYVTLRYRQDHRNLEYWGFSLFHMQFYASSASLFTGYILIH